MVPSTDTVRAMAMDMDTVMDTTQNKKRQQNNKLYIVDNIEINQVLISIL